METKRRTGLPGLKHARLRRGLTQEELGEKAGVSTRTVWNLEDGRTAPHELTVYKLARALRVSPRSLQEG